MSTQLSRLVCVSLLATLCASCVTPYTVEDRYLGRQKGYRGGGPNPFRAQVEQRVRAEEPGPWFIGRRYFKENYKFWGYIKRPREPWINAELVMLNEQTALAPDRDSRRLGSDDGAEYRLYGEFTGDLVYEPASNGFYPEFKLLRFELIDRNPPSIFLNGAPNDPKSAVIQRPQ